LDYRIVIYLIYSNLRACFSS